MADTGEWVVIDPEEFDDPATEHHQDVEINVFFSPYDLPRGVRGRYDEKQKRFRIEFQYLLPQIETNKVRIDANVTVQLGKKGRRLLAIEVNTDRMGAREVVLNVIPDTINQLIERHADYADNYRVVEEVIGDLSDQIFAGK